MTRPIPVLLITYNRMEYSKQALESICRNPGLPIELMIWDNGSTDGTVRWLLDYIAHRQQRNTVAVTVKCNEKNVGLAPAMNAFFRKYASQPYVVKVDNDTILPDNWLADLVEVMEEWHYLQAFRLGAISGTCLRPPGLSAKDWYAGMPRKKWGNHELFINPACLGTGVLINMDLIRERGLLFEHFPKSPNAGPDEPCLISGWGAYIQEAHAYTNWKFLMYSKVPVRLLNLKADQVLSNDYPEYDREVAKIRDEGNAWWESVGGLPGVKKYVEEHGGLARLKRSDGLPLVARIGLGLEKYPLPQRAAGGPVIVDIPAGQKLDVGVSKYPSRIWTEAGELEARSTFEFWDMRVKTHGTTASTFLTTPQARINEFTEKHMEILHDYAPGRDVLEVGIGWGRMSLPIAQLSKSYIGVDFIPDLVAKAKESLPSLDLRVATATALPFPDGQFDLVVAVACLSSFAAHLEQVVAEMKRVLRPYGRILLLEEDFARVDWKMENR